MTTETSNEDPGTTSEQATNPDTQEPTTQTSTDPSSPTPETPTPDPAAADPAAANLETDPDKADDPAAEDPGADTDKADPWAGQDLDEETKAFIGDKTPAQIAKELQNAQKLLGKKSIGIPGKDSTPEEQRAFHKARGVPEDENGYDLKPALESLKEVAPPGWEPAPELEASFRKAARLSNISQGEATEFAKHWLGEQFKSREQFVNTQMAAQKEAKAIMAREWGPDTTAHTAAFERGARAIGLEGAAVDVLLETIAGDGKARFAAVNAVAEIGRRFAENGPVPGINPTDGATTMTKEQARSQMDRIKADPVLSVAYTDITHPRHKEVTAEMTRLGKIERGVKS